MSLSLKYRKFIKLMGGFYLLLLTLGCLSKTTGESVPLNHPWDYFIHFSAYFLLMNWLHGEKQKFLGLPLFLVFWGGLIEIGQQYVGRDCSIEDFIANSLGVLMAFILRRQNLIFSSSELLMSIYERLRGVKSSGQ